MDTNLNQIDYTSSPSRLDYYKSRDMQNNSELWKKHLRILRILEYQATRLGMFETAEEFADLIAERVALQSGAELGGAS